VCIQNHMKRSSLGDNYCDLVVKFSFPRMCMENFRMTKLYPPFLFEHIRCSISVITCMVQYAQLGVVQGH